MDQPTTTLHSTDVALRHHGVAAVFLFGSQLHGRSGPLSDTDCGVLLQEPFNPHQILDRIAELEPVLAPLLPTAGPIEVTVLNTAPVSLQLDILRHGRLLRTLDPLAVATFRERVMQRAGDLQPFLRAYRADRLRRLYV